MIQNDVVQVFLYRDYIRKDHVISTFLSTNLDLMASSNMMTTNTAIKHVHFHAQCQHTYVHEITRQMFNIRDEPEHP